MENIIQHNGCSVHTHPSQTHLISRDAWTHASNISIRQYATCVQITSPTRMSLYDINTVHPRSPTKTLIHRLHCVLVVRARLSRYLDRAGRSRPQQLRDFCASTRRISAVVVAAAVMSCALFSLPRKRFLSHLARLFLSYLAFNKLPLVHLRTADRERIEAAHSHLLAREARGRRRRRVKLLSSKVICSAQEKKHQWLVVQRLSGSLCASPQRTPLASLGGDSLSAHSAFHFSPQGERERESGQTNTQESVFFLLQQLCHTRFSAFIPSLSVTVYPVVAPPLSLFVFSVLRVIYGKFNLHQGLSTVCYVAAYEISSEELKSTSKI